MESRSKQDNIEYIANKIKQTGTSFVLSSPCPLTLFETAQKIAKKVFITALNKNDFNNFDIEEKIEHIKKRIDEKSFPDFIILEPKGKEIKVESIRHILPTLNYKPVESTKRIIVIKDAHRLNKSTANAMLKSIEEPPEDTSFLILSTNINRLLPTVLSRSEIIRISPPTKEDFLKDENIDNLDINLLLEISGSNKLRFEFFKDNYELIEEIIDFIETKNKSFAKTQTLASSIASLTNKDIAKQEHFLYAISKILLKKNYNLSKKVLEIFEGIYFNTKDTLIFENILLEINK